MRANLLRWLSGSLVAMLVVSLLAGARPARAEGLPVSRLPSPDQTLQRIKTQIIVRFRDDVGASQASAAVRATGGSVTKSLAAYNTKLADYAGTTTAASALDTLNKRPDVVYAFFNQRVKLPTDQTKHNFNGKPLQRGLPLPNGRGKLPSNGAPRSGSEVSAFDRALRSAAAANEPLRGFQYALDRIGEPLAGAPERNAPTVAVIDSGMDYTNPDLAGAYQRCPDFGDLKCDLIGFDSDPMDDNLYAHGSHVSGIIAARSDATGIRGVSPNSKVLPVRIFDESGSTDLLTIFQALDYTVKAKSAIPSLRVANMSFGGYFLAGDAALQEFNNRLAGMRRAGILPVVSAGNESSFLLQLYPLFFGIEVRAMPAQSPYVLAVAATDENDYRTYFSNYSTPVMVNNCEKFDDYGYGFKVCRADNTYTRKEYRFAPVAAPGWRVLSTTSSGQYRTYSGTSMSAPVVAGVAARVLAKYPGLTLQQAQNRIGATGVTLGTGKGFPRFTRRVDLRAALGNTRTGFTGRVVDGVTGQPLRGATVSMKRGGATVGTAQTNAAGFYTITGATGGQQYLLSATKSAAPSYVPDGRNFVATRGRLSEPGTIALAPVRNDGAYTIVLEWGNVLTGIEELFNEYFAYDENGKGYPLPVRASSMPMMLADAVFSVPFPNEPSDSTEFTWYNRGALAAFPYARIQHDSEYDLSPHEGTIVRQLPADQGPVRYGVNFLSPRGHASSTARVTVYKNNTRLRRSEFAQSLAPTDGTQGLGTREYSMWALYDIRHGYGLRAILNRSSGQRSDYTDWVSRGNDIRGVRGPGDGGKVSGRLENDFQGLGAYYGDYADVYSMKLEAGQVYTFDLFGPANADFDLILYAPTAKTIYGYDEVAYAFRGGSRERIRYRVPARRGGTYYMLVYGYEGAGGYTLSKSKPAAP